MKKIFCLLAACCLVAALSTSCVKNCTCKAWTLGVAGDEYEIELDKDYYNTCSDMNTYKEEEGVKTGIECH